jgi:hypothetical protein
MHKIDFQDQLSDTYTLQGEITKGSIGLCSMVTSYIMYKAHMTHVDKSMKKMSHWR